MEVGRRKLKKEDAEKYCEDNTLDDDVMSFLDKGFEVYDTLDVEIKEIDEENSEMLVTIPLIEK